MTALRPAAPVTATPAPAEHGRQVEGFVLTGPDALAALGRELDDLHAAVAAPVTARRLWLQTWADCYPGFEPLVVGVRRAGRLEAAAPLAHRRIPGGRHVVALGHGPSDEARLPARDPAAAAALGSTLADALGELGTRCLVDLRHLAPDEPAVDAVAAALGHAAVAPGDVSPRLRLGSERDLRSYVSRNHHQQRRRLVNRIRRAGLRLDLRHLTDPAEIGLLMPQLTRLCRERDLALRGHSRLDDPRYARFLHEVVRRHAAAGQVVLTALSLDGELAAYLLCFRDGPAWRMWHARVRPMWQEFGAGRVATDAAVEAALADPTCSEFDWMRGLEPYKLSLSDHVHRAVDLHGCTTAAAWRLYAATLRTRGALRDVKNAHPSLARGWERLGPRLGRR